MAPIQVFPLSIEEETRFWSYVDILDLDSCWNWKIGKDKLGYGLFYMKEERHRSHRVAWTVCFGIIGDGLNILHKCDNRACCNPCHLREGTHSENMKDMAIKYRGTCGTKSWTAKLTPDSVIALRKRFEHGTLCVRSASEEFGVSKSAIRDAAAGRSWKYLLDGRHNTIPISLL